MYLDLEMIVFLSYLHYLALILRAMMNRLFMKEVTERDHLLSRKNMILALGMREADQSRVL